MDFIECVNLLSDMMQNPQNTPLKAIPSSSIHSEMYGPMLSKWAEKWWPTESIISPPICIVLKPALCAQSAFKDMLREKSFLSWNELT